MLWGCLLAMIVWSFIQLVFPAGPIGRTIFSLLGALLFRWARAGGRAGTVTPGRPTRPARQLRRDAHSPHPSCPPCCSAYLVFDTQLLIRRFELDDYSECLLCLLRQLAARRRMWA